MAKKTSTDPAEQRKAIMRDLPMFESAHINLTRGHMIVTRVPGGFMYNSTFVWWDEQMDKDLGIVKEEE
jgi:hypothetical protein